MDNVQSMSVTSSALVLSSDFSVNLWVAEAVSRFSTVYWRGRLGMVSSINGGD